MNKLDSELAASEFIRRGAVATANPVEADVVVLNTCSVRRHAEERALSHLGRLRRVKEQRPGLVIVLMGCMAQKEGERLLDAHPWLDVVCGTGQFSRLPELVELARTGERIAATDDAQVVFERLAEARPERHRAFLAVMRGCNSFCSYCVVPYVRGREVCRPPEEIEEEARRLVGDGCVEITLLGQNIDAYRNGDTDLAALLERLDRIEGLRRLRFITSHPRDISPRLLHTIADLPTVCEHLHMPGQSGSNRILAAMNRGYTAERYLEIVAAAREIVPGIEIASDFIVGFPGETDEDFEATASLVRACRFNQAFIFKYSQRDGTRAARMTDDVPLAVKEERNQRLLAIQEAVSREANAAKVGRVFEVMVEGPSKRDPSRLTGRTRGNDIVVFTHPGTPMPGELVRVRITGSTPLTLFGEIEFAS